MSSLIQSGCPGSGNCLTWNVLRILQGSRFRSFKEATGIARLAELHLPNDWTWQLWPMLDEWRQGGLEWFMPEMRVLPVDSNLLDRVSSLIFTHEKPSVAQLHFPYRQRFYVLRHPADAVASELHMMATPFQRRINPTFTCTSVEELLEFPGYVERLAGKWRDHVQDWLRTQGRWSMQGRWSVIRYEEIGSSDQAVRRAEITRLAGLLYANDPWAGGAVHVAAEETSLAATKLSSPRHVQRKRTADELGIRERVRAVCEKEMERFGYY